MPAGGEKEDEVEEEANQKSVHAPLTRAIRNIVDNAIRVSRPGDTIRIRTWREGERVVMTVEDSGPGIPPEHVDYSVIFVLDLLV
jgi:signal transduction histidine kinase